MKVNKIHHVAIICSNYEKSKNFYVNILGCEIKKETYRAERKSYKLDLLVGGEYQLELFSFPESPLRLSYPEALGLRHLAFEVEDIDQAIEELGIDNIFVEPIRVDEITGKRFTFFCDPDDLPLELYEKPR
ncbi:VOC family protein [Peribacillus muralis]|uniref:SMU1112c/YaeR family gloxylase I-like metalloprotein n=1 Tax=Peribacillus muralis TaxID=264697 RepID=UPI00070E2ABE|nr:VOC family protein [Peribacillus muralis]MCK1995043.1 VOC family protein [Peribacillus muralis]MCK2015586.1 VOC family protein [Peribacillus muralis]